MKHIYELTPTQARELKKLVENKSSYGKSSYDQDYIVSGGHKETISFWCGKHVSVVQNVLKLLQPLLIKKKEKKNPKFAKHTICLLKKFSWKKQHPLW